MSSSGESERIGDEGSGSTSLYFEIHASGDFGRYLVAKEDIDEKTLILSENPLLYGPTDDKDLEKDEVYIFCLACCKQLCPFDFTGNSKPEIYTCARCGWPVCDKLCERASVHSNNECVYFFNQTTAYPPPHEWLMYKSVILLRLLILLKRKPELWEDFLEKLEHHTETRHSKANCVSADEIVLENLEYFTQGLKLGSKRMAKKHRLPFIADKEILQRIIGTLNVNAFCANNSSTNRIARCMFQTASLFAHSCAPNCSWTIEMSLFDRSPSSKRRRRKRHSGSDSSEISKVTPQIQVYTAVPVKKGDMITIPYSTRNIFYGTLKRQISMESVGHFMCKCTRCLDPTELGTYMSSIRCFKCELGFLVSLDPSNEESQWICKNVDAANSAVACGCTCSVGKVVYFTTNIQDQIDRVRSKDLEWDKEMTELQRLFDKFCGKELHGNHYLLYEISTRIVELLEDRLTEENAEMTGDVETHLANFFFHINYMIKLANVILPGYNHYQDQLRIYLEEAEDVKMKANTQT